MGCLKDVGFVLGVFVAATVGLAGVVWLLERLGLDLDTVVVTIFLVVVAIGLTRVIQDLTRR